MHGVFVTQIYVTSGVGDIEVLANKFLVLKKLIEAVVTYGPAVVRQSLILDLYVFEYAPVAL